MAAPTEAPHIRAYVLSKGKVVVKFRAVPGATGYNLYSGSTRAAAVGTNEKQTVTIDATAGDYTLTYSGQETAAIAFDATAAEVQAALEALSNIAPGDVVVTGADGGPYTVEFTGSLARTNVAQMTSDATNLTGGASTATVATSVAGVAASTADYASGTVITLAVGTRKVYSVRAKNADGEGPVSNIVSLANLDYVDLSAGAGA